MSERTGYSEDPNWQVHDAIERIDRLSQSELMVHNMNYILEDVNRYARAAADIGLVALRSVLKRVLLVKAPQLEDATYIQDAMADLVFGPDELEVVTNAKQSSLNKRRAISEEVANGVDPWLSHVIHNERDIRNPVVTGFYQIEDGTIRTIYGPRTFQSKRQVPDTLFSGRNDLKEVNLLEGAFVHIQPTQMLKGGFWRMLPTDLKEHFERGEILTTTAKDLYRYTDSEIDELTHSDDPHASIKLLDKKVEAAEATGKYLLLYYSDYTSVDTGRTAVVMTTDKGKLTPLTVVAKNKEYVVEVKGCGTKAGGFMGMHFRTGRDIITGGAEADQARREFRELEADTSENGPKAVGSIIFENKDHHAYGSDGRINPHKQYEQGYIIRLTPSTVRGAFTGNDVYPEVEASPYVDRMLTMYAQQLVGHMHADQPKILDRSSHTENILVWGNGNYTFTDYSDHVTFADKDFPHDESAFGYMTSKQMLEYYVAMAIEIPGYHPDKDQQALYTAFTENFALYGRVIEFGTTDTIEQVTQKIWEKDMAYQVYVGRKTGEYVAEGVLREIYENLSSDVLSAGVPHASEAEFIAGEAQGRQNLLGVVDMFKRNERTLWPHDSNMVDLGSLRLAIETATITELVRLSDEVSTLLYTGKTAGVFTDEQVFGMYRGAAFYKTFNYLMIDKFRQYFEHELDVVVAAQQSCPDDIYQELTKAEQEVRSRIHVLEHTANANLPYLYKVGHDPVETRAFLQFSFYAKD